ncbi:MAG: GWxTD domain-containing protein [Candidatus Aminicenantes bacterium]|nr:MAG: GWxTD domain-containing protein [Candidatus Aminicenantes bacterium]
MKTRTALTIIGLLVILWGINGLNISAAKSKKKDPWKQWLKEVEPIMTRLERSVAKSLQTEEKRDRFKQLFWKARDPNPQTPENEYQTEFYRRIYYADKYLNGVKSDRGRIYVLLGEPENKSTFVGHQSLVECELWNYQGKDRPGLLPFMNLVFFKPHNTGDFQLYYPGIHKPMNLLAPQYANRIRSVVSAYKEIKMSSTELAGASLSIIPSEGDPRLSMSMSSSNFALNRIYSLPEREAEIGYVKSFRFPRGYVEVSHSTNAIRGFGYITVTRSRGIPFVHYALMPDVLSLQQPSKDLYTAEISLHISIEDLKGNIIYQNQKQIDLKLDPARKKKIDDQRVVFRDFAPIIEGQHEILTTFINKTTREFFSHKKRLTVPVEKNEPAISGVVGFQLKEINTNNFIPFTADNYLVLTDPRFTFSQKDALAGVVWAEGSPEIFLERINDAGVKVKIEPLSMQQNRIYKFRQPLTEVKDGNYRLIARIDDGKTVTLVRKIHILPFYIDIKRPFAIEKAEPGTARNNYIFVQAQQYLNTGKVNQAIAYFNQIPRTLWNATSLPIIARAYYKKGDYARVLELLEREEVKKEYPILVMLANSAIELKLYPRALEYLGKIREYGDTVEINQLVAATYISMGNRDKAMVYYERARQLKNKSQEPQEQEKQDKNKENNHE